MDASASAAGWVDSLQFRTSTRYCKWRAAFISASLAGFVFGTPEFPVSEVPLQEIVNRVAKGIYKAKPVAVISFDEIREAQRLMESGQAFGKIVVKL